MDFRISAAEAASSSQVPADSEQVALSRGSTFGRCRAGDIKRGRNPRGRARKITDKEWPNFVADVKAKGILMPIGVRALGTGELELVWGNSRLDAWLEAHGPDSTIEYKLVRASDDEALAMAFSENVHRADMTPVDEAKAAAWLLAQYDGDKSRVAERLSMSLPTLNARLALMNATASVQDAYLDQKLKLGHLELLAALPIPMQESALAKLLDMPTLPSVEAVRSSIAAVARPLKGACFVSTDCSGCKHNSETQAGLFAESIGGGSCTNPTCFNDKTQAKLEEIRASLIEETPRVEIVRPGQNHAVIQIRAEGPKGLGEQQAQACRQCADFGIAVSGVPGKEGQVYKDFCFKPSCHATLAAKHSLSLLQQKEAYAKAQAEARVQVQAEQAQVKASAATEAVGKAAGDSAARARSISAQVEEYRLGVWRNALAKTLEADQAVAGQFLVSLALTNQAHHIDRAMVADKVQFETGEKGVGKLVGFKDFTKALPLVSTMANEQITACFSAMAASAAHKVPEEAVRSALKHYRVELTRYFKVDQTLLKLLTKSQIEGVAAEIGLADKLDIKAAAAMKKPEMIAALLDVKNFNFAVLPAFMQP